MNNDNKEDWQELQLLTLQPKWCTVSIHSLQTVSGILVVYRGNKAEFILFLNFWREKNALMIDCRARDKKKN